MLNTRTIFVLAIATTLVAAQLSTITSATLSPATSTPATAAALPAKTWAVTVGKADHAFRPEVLFASIGDIVEFQFAPPNHSVVRAEYMYPCIPYELTGRGKVGFFSGFHTVDTISDDPPKWSLRINDTAPVFYYCSATGSCLDYQMVGVINPNATTSLPLQKELAGKSKYMLQPGQSFPAEGASSPSGVTGISNATTTATTAATAPVNKHSKGIGAGAIAGIVIAAFAIVSLVAASLCLVQRRRAAKRSRQREALRQQHSRNPSATPSPATFHAGGTVFVPIKASDFAEYNRHSGGDAEVKKSTPSDSDTEAVVPIRYDRREKRRPKLVARPESPTVGNRPPVRSRFDGI